MGRIVWVILILLILLIIVGWVFLSSLDTNQLLSSFRSYLEKQLHAKIQYRTASLSFAQGAALELQDLVITPEAGQVNAVPLTIQEARASVNLTSLLKMKLQIGSIELVRPRIALRISSEGQIEVPGFESKKFKTSSPGKSSAMLLPIALLIQEVQLAQAEIRIQNEMRTPPAAVGFSNLNLKIENLMWGRPFHFFISGSLDGNENNIALSGKMSLPPSGKPFNVSQLELETDLGQLQGERLWEFLDVSGPWPFRENPLGTLRIRADKISWDDEGLRDILMSLDLARAEVYFKGAPQALRELNLKLHASTDSIDCPGYQFEVAEGQVSGMGRISSWKKNPEYDFQVRTSNLSLAAFQPQEPGRPALEGKLSLDLRAQSAGVDSETFLSNLSGQGHVDWTEGRLANLNILHEILAKISVIPGLVERLNRDLSLKSKETINRLDTFFEPFHEDFTLQKGTWLFPNATLATDAFQLSGVFQGNMKGAVEASTMFRLDPDFTDILSHSINELAALTSAQGEMEIPLKISGQIPKLSFFPDLGYIGSKLAAAKASDFLSQFLGPKSTSQTPSSVPAADTPPEAPRQEPPPAPDSLRKIKLGKLLAAALTEPAPTRTPAPSADPAARQDTEPLQKRTPAASASVFDQLLQAALAPSDDRSEASRTE